MIRFTFALSLLLFLSVSVFSQSWKTYPYKPKKSVISFPIDEGRHIDEPVEWWYTSGHLKGETSGRNYSYMLSYFYYPTGPIDGFRILNISDDDKGVFHHEMQLLTYSELATDKLDLQVKKLDGNTELWKNKYKGTDVVPFEYEIKAASADVVLNLEYKTHKRPLIIGDEGYLKLGNNNYTYYYSQTGISVKGSITYDDVIEKVIGSSWIERQYGNLNPTDGTEYEWFSIQLSNNMDINVWNIFTGKDEIPDDKKFKIFAIYINDQKQYSISDFKLDRLGFAYSPDKEKCYAQKWHLTSQDNKINLIINTLYSDSEVRSPMRFYEGTTVIKGTVNGVKVKGKGFAELLHSYDKPDIVFINDTTLDISKPLEWKLNNPDDGSPLQYDLEYSDDDQITYRSIVLGISDTSFKWDTKKITNSDSIWLRLTGKSVDGTLKSKVIKKFDLSSNK